jgi:ABC-type siderophore export system fused ATPase/permease subunit
MNEPDFDPDHIQVFKPNQEPFWGEIKKWLKEVFLMALMVVKEGRMSRLQVSKGDHIDDEEEM